MNKYFSFVYWKNFLIGTPVKKRLAENFLSLSALQALNYLLPLVTLPYLVRILGPEKYGLISFAQAFIGYFIILTDYGFHFSATREVSINREDKEKVTEIFSSVITVKFLLGLVSLSILVLMLVFIPKFRVDWPVYVFTFGMVLGNILFPVWFFQGMERMKYITIINIVAKGIFTICIFIFIRRVSDYLYVPLINSLGYLVAGVLGLNIAFKNFKLKFILPTIKSIKHQLREGWHIFISTVSISLYTVSNTFILGLFTNNTIVGYYAGAEKIIKAGQGLITPVFQTVYPYTSKLASESKEKALNFIRKLVKLVGSVGFIISLIIFLLAAPVVNLVLGSQYHQSIIVLRILAFLPFIIGVATVYATLFLLGFGHVKEWSRIIIVCSLLDIIFVFILVGLFSLAHVGVSISWLLTEISVLLLSYFAYKKHSYGYR